MFSKIMSLLKSNSLKDLSNLLIKDELSSSNTKFSGTIINSVLLEKRNYLNLTIKIKEYICEEFLIFNALNPFKIGDDIEFESKNIVINAINGKIYIEISKVNIIKNNNKIKGYDNTTKKFHFDILKYAYVYNDIEFLRNKESYIFSIILKVKQVEKKEEQYEFFDMFQKKVPLDYSNINKLIEGQKIYLFTSLKYSKDLNDCFHLTPMQFSLVKLIDVSSILYNNILVNNLNIVSFKGKIKKFNIETNEIEITDENGQNITALLTNRLFKKIELGNDCFFNCFIKKKNGEKKNFLALLNFQIFLSKIKQN